MADDLDYLTGPDLVLVAGQQSSSMNAPVIHRAAVDAVLTAVGDRHGLRIVDLLPNGSVGHSADIQPVVFLAEKARDDLSLLELCSAEVELGDTLGFAARILLRSELDGSSQGRELLREVRGL